MSLITQQATTQTFGTVRVSLWMLKYALRRWPGMLAMLCTSLLGVAISVLKPWPLKVLVDNVLGGQPLSPAVAPVVHALPAASTPDGLLAWAVGATLLIFLLGWVQSAAVAYTNIGFGQRIVYDLATDLFAHFQQLSLRFHSRKPVGDSVRRVTTDSGSVSIIVKDAIFPMLSSLFTLLAVFAIMWSMDRELTLLALLVVPALVVVLRIYAGPMMRRSYAQQEAEGRMYTFIEETLSSLPAVQAYSREQQADARLKATTDTILAATFDTTRVQLQFKALSGLVTAIGTAALMYVGATHALNGTLTIGSILVFLSYLASLYAPLASLMYTSSTIQSAMGSAHRVIEIMNTKQDVQDLPGARPLPRVTGHVKFENVTYGYEPDLPVLHNITLDVPPGATVAFVGHSGAGKSTLVGMIARTADPWSGRVLVDGHDVRRVTLRSLRNQVSIVGQEPLLLPITIAENIAYGKPNATYEQIKRAAVAACAHTFIERLPDGYNTVVGERGATLSGGEKQRISIARALLKDAPILILDEPTGSLDASTESDLMQALRDLAGTRTIFLIAHRLSTAIWADRIIVMDRGRILEQGTHADLIAAKGAYAALFDLAVPVAPGAPDPVPLDTPLVPNAPVFTSTPWTFPG